MSKRIERILIGVGALAVLGAGAAALASPLIWERVGPSRPSCADLSRDVRPAFETHRDTVRLYSACISGRGRACEELNPHLVPATFDTVVSTGERLREIERQLERCPLTP